MITGLSFLTNLGLTLLLTEVICLPEEASFAIALATVFVMNFLFMRYYIYASREASAKRQFVMYGLSAIGFRGLEYISFLIIHTWLNVQYAVAIVYILACSSLIKFCYFKIVVFRKQRHGVGNSKLNRSPSNLTRGLARQPRL
jgi:putative flippase GtrA